MSQVEMVVTLGEVSVNGDRISVPVTIDRPNRQTPSPEAIDQHFTGAQLSVRFFPQNSKVPDAGGQETFGDDSLAMIAQAGAVSMRMDSFRVTVAGPAPDDDELRGRWTRLSKLRARAVFERTGENGENGEA